MAERYLGVLGLAKALGVSRHAVHKWRARHPGGSPHPFPEPDATVDGAPGWRPERVEEIMHWRDGLPGRGAGGGRPSAIHQEFFHEATFRGMDADEAQRTLDAFANSFPEKTEREICAWLLEEWRS